MQLLFAQKSPYSRRARLAVRLSGLLDRVEEVNICPGPAGLAALPMPIGGIPAMNGAMVVRHWPLGLRKPAQCAPMRRYSTRKKVPT